MRRSAPACMMCALTCSVISQDDLDADRTSRLTMAPISETPPILVQDWLSNYDQSTHFYSGQSEYYHKGCNSFRQDVCQNHHR